MFFLNSAKEFISNIFGKGDVDRDALNDDQATIVAFGDRILKIFCGKNNIGSDLVDVKKRIHSLDTKEKIKIYKDGKLVSEKYELISKHLRKEYSGKPDYKYINKLFLPIDNLLNSKYQDLKLEGANNTLKLIKNACSEISKASGDDLVVFDDNVKKFFKLVYKTLPDSIQEINQAAQQVRNEKEKVMIERITKFAEVLFDAYNNVKPNFDSLGNVVAKQILSSVISSNIHFYDICHKDEDEFKVRINVLTVAALKHESKNFGAYFIDNFVNKLTDKTIKELYTAKIKDKFK